MLDLRLGLVGPGRLLLRLLQFDGQVRHEPRDWVTHGCVTYKYKGIRQISNC